MGCCLFCLAPIASISLKLPNLPIVQISPWHFESESECDLQRGVSSKEVLSTKLILEFQCPLI